MCTTVHVYHLGNVGTIMMFLESDLSCIS